MGATEENRIIVSIEVVTLGKITSSDALDQCRKGIEDYLKFKEVREIDFVKLYSRKLGGER